MIMIFINRSCILSQSEKYHLDLQGHYLQVAVTYLDWIDIESKNLQQQPYNIPKPELRFSSLNRIYFEIVDSYTSDDIFLSLLYPCTQYIWYPDSLSQAEINCQDMEYHQWML